MVQHRERYKANYSLVVAPGFSDGSLAVRCAQQKITPLTASDLGKLLEYTVEFGALPVTKLRELFARYNPTEVSKWVSDLKEWLKTKRPLTLNIFLQALEKLRGKVPDVLSASLLAYTCQYQLNAIGVRNEHVIALAKGLSILIPDLVGIDGDKIVVNASAERVGAAVTSQLEHLHDDSGLVE
jgi:hypothetical protein